MAITSITPRPFFLRARPGSYGAAQETTQFVCGLTKWEAEELLDWLEASGCRKFELTFVGEDALTVCYR